MLPTTIRGAVIDICILSWIVVQSNLAMSRRWTLFFGSQVVPFLIYLANRNYLIPLRRLVHTGFAYYGIRLTRGDPINKRTDCDIAVLDDRFYSAVIKDASLAIGEGYARGWLHIENVEETVSKLVSTSAYETFGRAGLFKKTWAKVMNLQTRILSERVAHEHYDVGNDLFSAMLDPSMQYSCAYWSDGITTLEDAQVAKMDLICRKLHLSPGMKVLDIGCGWGGLMDYIRRTYGAEVIGVTISREQVNLGKYLFPDCRFVQQDYRAFCLERKENYQRFDRVVSIGFFEHVGPKNYRTYFECVKRVLNPKTGIHLLHTVGGNRSTSHGNTFLDKYIFPGGVLPSIAQIGAATENLFVMEDWHNFGPYYAPTLREWDARAKTFFEGHLDHEKYADPCFQRTWHFYLASCAAVFKTRKVQLWQIVFTPNKSTEVGGILNEEKPYARIT